MKAYDVLRGLMLAGVAVGAIATARAAELAVIAIDRKVELVDGVVRTIPQAGPDQVAIVDLAQRPVRVIATIEAPVSVVGPPQSAAITPNGELALVTSHSRLDPANTSRQISDNRLSVIDLTMSPPRVIATVQTGAAPAGIAINPAGTLAIVANRAAGSVSVFSIAGKTVAPVATLSIGPEASGPSGVVITPDGRRALVTRDGDHRITVLAIDGTTVTATGRDMQAGIRPYGIDVARNGRFAVTANIGTTSGDADTVSLMDLSLTPPRVVDTISVGQTPEGITMSPDGSLIAVVVMNGSNRAANSPFFNAQGRLVLLRIDNGRLVRVTEAPIGRWSQGALISADNRTILVGNMVERNAQVLSFDGTRLTDTGEALRFEGGVASFSQRGVRR